MRFLAPRLFISYSRHDEPFVQRLVSSLNRRGFRVFVDTNDISPGDNFVSTIAGELRKATGVIAVVSEHYAQSVWGKAELYWALASRTPAIPIVLDAASLAVLDEPLQRMLQSTNHVRATSDLHDPVVARGLADSLANARKVHLRRLLLRRVVPIAAGIALVAAAAWWVVANLNVLEQSRQRERVLGEVGNATAVIQRDRIVQLAPLVAGDRAAVGELFFMSRDPARTDAARFNALALGSVLASGQKAYRWYPRDLRVDHTALAGVVLANVSFLGGQWTSTTFTDSTFAGAFWPKDKGVSLSDVRFENVLFYGSEFEAVPAIDVTFINSKFRGSTIDTTNFSKVRFVTQTPKFEGNPVITPIYALIEQSVVVSNRTPPAGGVMDLTAVGDDVVFDNVVFVDCRLEGWFRPEWFRNSSFRRCTLPPSLSRKQLEDAGNTVE